MIARLRGILLERRGDAVVIEASGVGYLARVTARTLAHLPALGKPVDLYTHLHVTESALDLFGFGDVDEQHAFELLLRVNGIGPRTAMQILSAIAPAELAELVATGNKVQLRAVPGIGPKTAERLIVELRDLFKAAFAAQQAGAGTQSGMHPGEPPGIDEQAIAALVGLGLKPAQAGDAVRRARGAGSESLEDVVRDALRLGVQR